MREHVDIETAVRTGIIGEDQATALRNLDARQTGASAATMERVEVPTSLADIMIAAGLGVLMLAGIAMIGMVPPIALGLMAFLFWMSRRHTIERGRAATAHVIFFFFAVLLSLMALYAAFGFSSRVFEGRDALTDASGLWLVGLIVTFGCWLWWRWARLPMAVAAGWVASLNLATSLLRLVMTDPSNVLVNLVTLGWGVVLLGVALWWDLTDIRRETVRSRVAFWCHVAAGFFISGAVLKLMLGSPGDAAGWMRLYIAEHPDVSGPAALPFLGFFAACLLLSLVIDRRSLIFATMYQAFVAMVSITGILPLAMATVGGLLLVLGLRWQTLRKALLDVLPVSVRAQVPRTSIENAGVRPTRRHVEMRPRRFGRAPAREPFAG
ncbi:hypothetical protein H8M03_04295 [Sphingomonas sabuli]|uniref:DUF2157 domain-containing protein n=1 Tax=Sphingomonas sabuli TaxID=2764186 RepID=A0A7G9L4K8_9SPHN|nr:hypothetical protein [Sphingomonas sabuli]QNM83557.1 hypothetical protein H8M03_04295 [Sphingomonas sabuli]